MDTKLAKNNIKNKNKNSVLKYVFNVLNVFNVSNVFNVLKRQKSCNHLKNDNYVNSTQSQNYILTKKVFAVKKNFFLLDVCIFSFQTLYGMINIHK